MTDHTTQRDAIVIGGSMAGLLAARALSDHYERVVVLERDILPTDPEPRKGTPQAQHAHALLASGARAIEGMFPGILGELVAAGAPRGAGRFFSGGGYHARDRYSPGGLFVSRPFLEWTVRRRVAALPNVEIVDGCDVTGVVATPDNGRVTGVRVTRRGDSGVTAMPARLVVDATGRGSRSPAWLEALGYAPPEVEVVEVGMGYSSRFYRREHAHLDGDVFVNVAPLPSNPRACGMMSQEGDRWIVTLAGYHGDHPPTDEQGYLEFARNLPTPEVYAIVSTASPLTEPVAYRFRSNQWRHYEKLKRFPAGFLVIGDAIASFTPIYGQGMSVAAQEAVALSECLRAGDDDLAARFFRKAAVPVSWAWTITVGNDAALLGPGKVRNPTPPPVRWYLGKVQVAARSNVKVATAFMEVGTLLKPPASLMRPPIAARVLWANLTRRAKRPASVPAADAVTAPSRA